MDLPDTSYDNDRGLLTSPIPRMRRGVSTSPGPGPLGQSNLGSHSGNRKTPFEVVLPASPGTVHLEEASDRPEGGQPSLLPSERATDRTYAGAAAEAAAGRRPSHLAPERGLVFRGDQRSQTDFEQTIDDNRHGMTLDDNARRSSSYIDRGYLSESRFSPSTVGRHGVDWEQQPLLKQQQLAQPNLVNTSGNVGVEPMFNDGRVRQPMMQHATSAGAMNETQHRTHQTHTVE